jgi:DNA-binding transcriptional LysR family regulator
MDITYLSDFLELVQCSSFSDAARRVGVTESALSKRIRRMEEELGVELIDRDARAIKLTPAGSAFLHASIDITNRYAQALNELQQVASRQQVTVGGMVHDGLVRSMLADISGENAAYALNVESFPYSIADNPIERGQLDALFALGDPGVVDTLAKEEAILLKKDRAYVAMNSTCDLASKHELVIDDLRGHMLLRLATQREATNDGWHAIEESCRRAGFQPNFVIEDPVGGHINLHDSLFILPESRVGVDDRIAGESDVVYRPLVDDSIRLNLYLFTSRKPTSPGVSSFIDDVRKWLSSHRPELQAQAQPENHAPSEDSPAKTLPLRDKNRSGKTC